MNEIQGAPSKKGQPGWLKLFIGAAPGVGKTYKMLREAHSLLERGADVVVGYVDVHDRPETASLLAGLELIARRQVAFRGREFEEIDVDMIIARHPQVVVIDELAHSNVPGSKHGKRYMDVEYLIDHGIDVLTAVNIQHMEHVSKEAEQITGVTVREIIPNEFVKRANEIEVIDVTPETLRQRLRDGSIYPMEKVEQALEHFFRSSNLSALRELALREVADSVDERLQQTFDRSKIPGPVGVRETILVCVSYTVRAERLIQTGRRVADRMKADLIILTVIPHHQESSKKSHDELSHLGQLAERYQARYMTEQLQDRKLGAVIMDVAEALSATQIVIGQPHRSHKFMFWRDSPVRYLLHHIKYADLRIVGWKE